MRPRFSAVVLVTGACGALFACNLIVGVHDVKLRKDSGTTERDGEIVLPPEVEGGTGPEPSRFTELALGKYHTCAKRRSGTVKCWGDDGAGQIGTGGKGRETSDAGIPVVPTPVFVENVSAFTIAAGAQHTCVAQVDGTVSCWGFNVSGQLGNGSTTTATTPTPTRVLVDALRLGAGSSHTCAVRRNGELACWGSNATGQLGNASTTSTNVPIPLQDLQNVKGLTLGQSHSCAFTSTGDAFCWGENFNGQLATTGASREVLPRKCSGVSGVTAMAASNDSTCAVVANGGVVCWGKDDLGQLGKGVAGGAKNPTPTPVQGVAGATAIAAGAEHFCALTGEGTVFCWGSNRIGQLGSSAGGRDGGGAEIVRPTVVAGLSAVAIGAGGEHTCAVKTDDGIACWGDNGHGELGIGLSKASSSLPVAVSNFP
ncbi:MAG: hypothetical protein IPF92_18180 [Myxococcales bacterium]|nr:hypothetical protein [Myxococcales bacterium]MBL0196183.1 hypothetical protein [Myxococcales bacterium]HQY65355.1 hypothetical protein [Polyangiaceae bacterium]